MESAFTDTAGPTFSPPPWDFFSVGGGVCALCWKWGRGAVDPSINLVNQWLPCESLRVLRSTLACCPTFPPVTYGVGSAYPLPKLQSHLPTCILCPHSLQHRNSAIEQNKQKVTTPQQTRPRAVFDAALSTPRSRPRARLHVALSATHSDTEASDTTVSTQSVELLCSTRPAPTIPAVPSSCPT